MIYTKYINTNGKRKLRFDTKVIVFSSLLMGVLASISMISQLHTTITCKELIVNSSIAFFFSLIIWYFNIYNFSSFLLKDRAITFFNKKLIRSLFAGMVIMEGLVLAHQSILLKTEFRSIIPVYQFRGVLINLTIYIFIYLSYLIYNSQQIKLEFEKLRIDYLNNKYKLIKKQVNPHFLFNSLCTLKSMIDINDKNKSKFVIRLANFYRFILVYEKFNLIPLKKELIILEEYIFLLPSRFERRIKFKIEINENILNSYIPPFTLQMLVENCIKHNIALINSPLTITLYNDEKFIIIENNFQPKNINQGSAGIGIENISTRYEYFTKKKLIIQKDYFKFTVKLPITYESFNN
ncbi:histidine kinase [Chryseobacterium sp.]|uniref:sensor histidine kinase n=1 Tax=Chryseobacterium sp. TaxID=1871047 RepID=UPI0031E0B302